VIGCWIEWCLVMHDGWADPQDMRMKLTDFTTLTFDVMGTLMDYEAGFIGWFRQHAAGNRPDIADNQILEGLARAEERLQQDSPHPPFTRMLPLMYLAVAGEFGLPPEKDLAESFGASVAEWPPFPDAVESLAYLRSHYRLVAVTNADRLGFERMHRALGEPFHDAVTAEDVGVTKPDRQIFAYMLGRLSAGGTGKRQILHTAQSQYHDIGPARSLGLATAWIERRRGQQGFGATPVPRALTTPDFHYGSLAEMVAAHRQVG
jgi:putative hydrolase of the HAD superfamily